MCQEILNFKNNHNNDFSNYFNLKSIDHDAEILLNQFYNNKDYHLSNEKVETDIIAIARIMGFKLFHTKLEGINRNISGMIGVSKALNGKYSSDKVIILNSEDSDEHLLFTIAHEIAHYIYDYNPIIHHEYFNKYNTEESQTDSEIRANRFAASFMMPRSKFEKFYNNKLSKKENIDRLSRIFQMPKTSVERRIIELELSNNVYRS